MKSDQVIELLQKEVETKIKPMGYEVVAIEQSSHGGSKLVVYIDFLDNADESKRIGLEDCLSVNKAVDDLFETTELINGNFTLEVSSPGVERPLRKSQDYLRFTGKKARLQTFGPLNAEEVENEAYLVTHKKQKNFVGTLEGLTEDKKKVRLLVDGESIRIPFEKISKAHLEADFTL